jgi:hypothetical protein
MSSGNASRLKDGGQAQEVMQCISGEIELSELKIQFRNKTFGDLQ